MDHDLDAVLEAAEALLLAGETEDALNVLQDAESTFWGSGQTTRIRGRLPAYHALHRAGCDGVAAHLLALGVDQDVEGHLSALARGGVDGFGVDAVGPLFALVHLGAAAVEGRGGPEVQATLARLEQPVERVLGADGLACLKAALRGDRAAVIQARARIEAAAEVAFVKKGTARKPRPIELELSKPKDDPYQRQVHPWILFPLSLACFAYVLLVPDPVTSIAALGLGAIFFVGAVTNIEAAEATPANRFLAAIFEALRRVSASV